MCGINGIYECGENTYNRKAIVSKMNDSLRHRGPDDEGIWGHPRVALGHRRLSIIDLSAAGHQPMQSSNGRYTITFNGEIYNYQELRKEIDGYAYQSSTDTEVLLAAYEKWGVACLEKLNGMFAFAIWDKHREELFIARDRLGIKPLYYYHDRDRFLFSSELRALLDSGQVPRKLNRESLWDYCRYQTVHASDTIIKDVSMVMPGHYMLIGKNKVETKYYWKLGQTTDGLSVSEDYNEIKSDINRLLRKAVERRLVGDVPFGAFLSGGIDSSIIVGLMSRLIPGRVNTFSVTFKESVFDESSYSQLIANKFGTDHTEIQLSADQLLDYLPAALDAMDHPSGDGPNTYLVSKVTRQQGVTMALSGLGGDELFAGYDIFKRGIQLQKLQWLSDITPDKIKSLTGTLAMKFHRSVAAEKMDALLTLDNWSTEETYPVYRQLFLDAEIKGLLSEKVPQQDNAVTHLLKNGSDAETTIPNLSKISMAEISTYMQNVLLRDTDQMSMASALEVRVPFLDHELVEYLLQVADNHKYPHTPKKLLTDSVDGLIPRSIINRKKMGFEFPWKIWLKNELFTNAQKNINRLSERPFIKSDQLKRYWQRFLDGDSRINWSRIWTLIVLEQWMEKNGVEY